MRRRLRRLRRLRLVRRSLAPAAVALAVLSLAVPAGAASLTVRIREAVLEPGGSTRLVLAVSGLPAGRALSAVDLAITEGGTSVEGVEVAPLSTAAQHAVVLVLDVSGSTAGRPLADMKAAAVDFLRRLPQRSRVALVAFGEQARVLERLTADRGRIAGLIRSLSSSGDTALYDGVVAAAGVLRPTRAQGDIVVFSDGRDTSSRRSLGDATGAARGARSAVHTVLLRTRDADQRALERLASATGGRALAVGQSASLSQAFASVARDISSQYVVTYTAPHRPEADFEIRVVASVGDAAGADTVSALDPGPAGSSEGGLEVHVPSSGFAGSTTGLLAGLAMAFAAVALLLLFAVNASRRDLRAMRKMVRWHSLRAGSRRRGGGESPEAAEHLSVAKRAAELAGKLPRPRANDRRLAAQLERAGWSLRPSEFYGIRLIVGVAAALVGGMVLGRLWLVPILGAVGWVLPTVALSNQVQRRQNQFMAQLPDTLQLLAGSLKAGYAFSQAIDTLVRESAPPTSTEFGRVLTELRLGMPFDQALEAMAERIDSEDFRWVVLAIDIQRQVGGNLAELLETVANTLRERERVRRQIRVLSAEGRLSAVVLTVLPFAIAGWIFLVNPGYLNTLLDRTLGRMMLGGSLVMMMIGIAWMRRLIRVDI